MMQGPCIFRLQMLIAERVRQVAGGRWQVAVIGREDEPSNGDVRAVVGHRGLVMRVEQQQIESPDARKIFNARIHWKCIGCIFCCQIGAHLDQVSIPSLVARPGQYGCSASPTTYGLAAAGGPDHVNGIFGNVIDTSTTPVRSRPSTHKEHTYSIGCSANPAKPRYSLYL